MTTEITTVSGFHCYVDEDALDDIELLETLSKLDQGDVTVLPSTVEGLLGPDGRAALYEHIRTPAGRVPITKVVEELGDIMQGLKSAKAKK